MPERRSELERVLARESRSSLTELGLGLSDRVYRPFTEPAFPEPTSESRELTAAMNKGTLFYRCVGPMKGRNMVQQTGVRYGFKTTLSVIPEETNAEDVTDYLRDGEYSEVLDFYFMIPWELPVAQQTPALYSPAHHFFRIDRDVQGVTAFIDYRTQAQAAIQVSFFGAHLGIQEGKAYLKKFRESITELKRAADSESRLPEDLVLPALSFLKAFYADPKQ